MTLEVKKGFASLKSNVLGNSHVAGCNASYNLSYLFHTRAGTLIIAGRVEGKKNVCGLNRWLVSQPEVRVYRVKGKCML